MSDPSFPYLEDDGGSWLLLQDPGGAEGLEVRVWVVEEVGVVVDQQRLDVVEDEAELVGVLHRVQARVVLRHQGGSEAAHARGVQHFTHLGRTNTGRGLKQKIKNKKRVVRENPTFGDATGDVLHSAIVRSRSAPEKMKRVV